MLRGVLPALKSRHITYNRPQEAANYLVRVVTTYSEIVGSKEEMNKLAPEDVRALELRCPRVCSQDANEIKTATSKGEIFRAFSQAEREQMLEKIFSFNYIIPSLRTFFQDMYVLDDCATSMKYLLKPGRETIRSALQRIFNIQEGRKRQESGSSFDEAIQVLWAFALRNFLKLPKPSGRRDGRRLAKPLAEGANHETVRNFAKLAHDLGFRSREIERLAQIVPAAVENTRESGLGGNLTRDDGIRECSTFDPNTMLVKSGENNSQLQRRCGRLRYDTYCRIQELLVKDFLQQDYGGPRTGGSDIAPFFVVRSQYLSFFNISGQCQQHHAAKTAENEKGTMAIMGGTNPPTLVQSVLESRDDTASEYSDLTVVSLDTGPVNEEHSSPLSGETMPHEQQRAAQVAFKGFKDNEFITSYLVDAGNPEAIWAAGRDFITRDNMKLFSTALRPINLEECADAAKDSGLNTIIVLPAHDLEISPAIRKAAGRLRRVE